MKLLKTFLFCIMLFSLSAFSQEEPTNYQTSKQEITNMMLQQAKDWSKGDLVAFMQGYIKSDRLKFVGSKGITYGWEKTLENYKKGYPSPDHTGILTFDLIEFDALAEDVYLVIGAFHLKRKVGDTNGMFSVILKRIEGKWKIIADHSS